MNMLSPDIRLEYNPSESFEVFREKHIAAMPAWRANEPVPSLHRSIGKLHVPADTLALVEQDVASLNEEVAGMFSNADFRFLSRSDLEVLAVCPPHLMAFLQASSILFQNAILADVGLEQADNLLFGLRLGPYVAARETDK